MSTLSMPHVTYNRIGNFYIFVKPKIFILVKPKTFFSSQKLFSLLKSGWEVWATPVYREMPDLKFFSLNLLNNPALVEPPQHEPSYHREEHHDKAGGTENEVVDQHKPFLVSRSL